MDNGETLEGKSAKKLKEILKVVVRAEEVEMVIISTTGIFYCNDWKSQVHKVFMTF